MRKRWILITIIIFVIISIVALNFEPLLKGDSQNLPLPWMFKGAYATYEGHIDSLLTPCNLSAEIQVTDINASHVQIRTSSTIATTFMHPATDHTIQWINKTSINFQPKGENLKNSFDTEIAAGTNKIQNCIAYEYTNELINATYYLNKDILWPVRITYTTVFENQTYSMEFNLRDTNIEALS